MQRNGVKMDYLSIANEPDWPHTQPSYFLSPDDHAMLFEKVSQYLADKAKTHPEVPRPLMVGPNVLSAVDAATTDWTPDLVLVSAGFDCLAGDPLGGFTLELEHVEQLTRALVTRAERWCGGRLVSALEGGYDPVRLGDACVTHLRALR